MIGRCTNREASGAYGIPRPVVMAAQTCVPIRTRTGRPDGPDGYTLEAAQGTFEG